MTSKQKYITVAANANHWPIFAQPYWLDAVCADWQVFHASINGLDFYTPYQTEKKLLFTFVRNFYLTPYTCLYCTHTIVDDNTWQQAWQTFHNYFKQFAFVQLDQHFLLPSLSTPISKLSINKYHTNTINATLPIDTILKTFKPSLQRHIKFAASQLQVSTCNNANTLFDLITSTAHFRGIKNGISLPLIKQVLQICTTNNCGTAWQATDANGVVQAILLQVWDKGCSYSIIAANQYPTVFRGAMALLLWHAIQHTATLQIPVFDFEGSRQKGIDDFFKTFGTTQQPVYQLEMYNNIVVKTLLKIKKS